MALIAAIRAARAAGLLKAEHLLHLRCEVSTEHVVTDFAPHADDPLVRLVSLMDHAPGPAPVHERRHGIASTTRASTG